MQSDYAAFLASKRLAVAPSGFNPEQINPLLFDFQQAMVRWACQRGRAALFADCGLGKGGMALEWATQVHRHTGGDVLILAPLCVAQQFLDEAAKFGYDLRYCRQQSQVQPGLTVTNYEMLDKFEPSAFVGVVLDESSILKAQDSKTRTALIAAFRDTPYRLACTATPSPNDYMELGNHAEFLGIMSQVEMLATFFTHDGGNTSQWRLKGHAKTRFWEWMSHWAVGVRNPADLGFDGSAYCLPPLQIHEHLVQAELVPEGQLFAVVAQTLTERRQAKKESLRERCQLAADLVNAGAEPFIVWCHLNEESSLLAKLIPDAVEVYGSLPLDEKEKRVMAFAHGQARVLISKPSITGHGMNFQHCANQVFVGLTDSFEEYYQAVRRSYRFGQTRPVQIHLIAAESEGAVKANLERKQAQALAMAENMVAHMRELTRQHIQGARVEKADYACDVAHGDGWELHLGDCVEVVSGLADNRIDFSIFSPPYSALYCYSASDRDMGNSRSDEQFYQHFEFLITELMRVLKPGRIIAVDCMNIPAMKFKDGYIGLKDFRGDLIRLFQQKGFIFHSEHCVWRDPLIEATRTKSVGLLHKQLCKDSSMSRAGIPSYLLAFRKPGENRVPIAHPEGLTAFYGEDEPVAGQLSHERWRRLASPVWMDIRPTDTLNVRAARENEDEKHIAPMPLDIIRRGVQLWSNPGDTVYDPFTGIGSTGVVALQLGRRFVGSELKPAYFKTAVANLREAVNAQGSLFTASISIAGMPP